jgi:hypothetical protein
MPHLGKTPEYQRNLRAKRVAAAKRKRAKSAETLREPFTQLDKTDADIKAARAKARKAKRAPAARAKAKLRALPTRLAPAGSTLTKALEERRRRVRRR